MQILLRNPFIKAILLSNFYLVPANTCTGTYLLLSHSNQYSGSIVMLMVLLLLLLLLMMMALEHSLSLFLLICPLLTTATKFRMEPHGHDHYIVECMYICRNRVCGF